VNWFKKLTTAEFTENYGYWVLPNGRHLPVGWMEHAQVAYNVLRGRRPTGLEDYATPFAAGWWRLVTYKDALAHGPGPATRIQAEKAGTLLLEAKRAQALVQFEYGDFGFVPIESVPAAMQKKIAIKKNGPIGAPTAAPAASV
jgi:hypothetical protein